MQHDAPFLTPVERFAYVNEKISTMDLSKGKARGNKKYLEFKS